MPETQPWDTVDLVDAYDQVVGRAPVAEAIASADAGFRTAHILLFNSDAQVLLQRLSAERIRHPLRWGSSVAAIVHAGETYEDAARRRMREEIGLEVPLKPVGVATMPEGFARKHVGLFHGFDGAAENLEPTHIAALEWFDVPDFLEMLAVTPELFTPTLRHLVREFPFFLPMLET